MRPEPAGKSKPQLGDIALAFYLADGDALSPWDVDRLRAFGKVERAQLPGDFLFKLSDVGALRLFLMW